MTKKLLLPLCWIVLLFVPACLHAQVTGTISGYVLDPSGAAIPGVTVSATSVGQQLTRTAVSNVQGFYDFPAMPPGSYNVSAESPGFQRMTLTGITVSIDQNVRIDLKLQLGQAAEAVTVTAETTLVESRSATVSALVDDRRVVDLPLNGRNVMALAATLPGVSNVSAPQQLSDARSGPTMNVNGGQVNMNLFTFNGGFFNNPSRNTGMNYPPPDALQEFRIVTQNFSAEHGRNAGSQVNVVSKSGTNDFHGSAWEFLRNNKLNARNFFADRVPSLKQNQFGVAAGGPIRRDKLFFFGSYQGLRERPEAVAAEATVPSEAERAGDFTALLNGSRPTTLRNPIDPISGQPFTDAFGQPCLAGNVVRPGCISPVAKNFLQYVPVTASGRIVTLTPNPRNDDMYMARLDWNHSSKHMLSANLYVDDNGQSREMSGGNIPGYVGNRQDQKTTMVTLNDTYTFSPNVLNQAMLSFLRTYSLNDATQTIEPGTLGMDMPQYSEAGAPHVDVTGYFNFFGSSGRVLFTNHNWHFRNDVSWMRGRHSFKFGGEVLKLWWRQVFLGNPTFTFNGSRTGDAFADFLLGAYRNFTTGFGVRENDNLTTLPAFYFQDEYRLNSRVTLNFGLRYEPFLPWVDRYDRLSAFAPGQKSSVLSDAPPNLLFAGDPGLGRGIIGSDLNNFAPRFGFAWDVTGNGTTSVRGGYGVYYDLIKADSVAQENAPWAGNVQNFDGRFESPFGALGQVAPPVTPKQFGCSAQDSFPGVDCNLFPLPMAGFYLPLDMSTAYIQSWNLTLQRQLTPTVMIQSAYIGKIGTKIEARRNVNPARFINDPITGEPPSLQNVNNRVIYAPGIISPLAKMMSNDHRNWYHSWQTQLTRRFAQGLSLSAAYTLSKSLDTLSNNIYSRLLDNPFDLSYNRGRSDFDRRHAFVASWVWSPELRFESGALNAILGNWTLTGIHTLQSGLPMTFAMGDDVALDGTGSRQHAQLTGSPIAREHGSRGDMIAQFFNTGAFVPTAQVPRGIYGDLGRNILSGPGMANNDMSAMKDIPVAEGKRLQFRAEFFNAFNQVRLSNPDSTVNSKNFGRIRSAGSPRVIQFALKFLW